MFVVKRHHGCRLEQWKGDDGHTYIFMENRYLRVGFLLTQGADLVEFRFKPYDLDVLWHTPQGISPVGTFIPTVNRDAGNFLDHLHGGWFESLPNGYLPCTYRGAEMGNHGEVALLPWSARVVRDCEDQVSVQFWVRTRRTPFLLEKTVSLEKEATFLEIEERLANEGEEKLSYIWGHHPSIGEPFLEERCTIELPPCMVCTPDPSYYPDVARYKAGQQCKWPVVVGTNGSDVRVDLVPSKEIRACDLFFASGFSEGKAAIWNPRFDLEFFVEWDAKVFPYVWIWQAYGGAWGWPFYGRAYQVAIEPFATPIITLPEAEAQGLAPILEGGQQVVTFLRAGFRIVSDEAS